MNISIIIDNLPETGDSVGVESAPPSEPISEPPAETPTEAPVKEVPAETATAGDISQGIRSGSFNISVSQKLGVEPTAASVFTEKRFPLNP